MKKFIEELLIEDCVTELDLEFPFYNNVNGKLIPNEVEIANTDYAEAPSMDIDKALEIIQKFKDNGCNRIYFESHCDHSGYYFYGINLKEKNNEEE
jgi:hypothetical protein